jgi:hypothetical protein
MKILILTTILVIIIMLNMANAQDSVHYYSNETPKYLYIDTTRLLIKFNGMAPVEGYNLILPSFPQLTYDSSFAWHWIVLAFSKSIIQFLFSLSKMH